LGGAGKRIEQRRFPGVGIAGEGDRFDGGRHRQIKRQRPSPGWPARG
jgi:hypothetical protein